MEWNGVSQEKQSLRYHCRTSSFLFSLVTVQCAMLLGRNAECEHWPLARLATVMSFNYAVMETRQSIPF